MPYSYEKFLKELGARLRQLRIDRKWTLRAMIVQHGFHLAQWQGFEKGKGISVPSLLRMCDVFDVTLTDLIDGLGLVNEDTAKPKGLVTGTAGAKKKQSRPSRSKSKAS